MEDGSADTLKDGPGRRWYNQRKVRAPQGMMPGNTRALIRFFGTVTASAAENIPPLKDGKGEMVR